jgi:hypothetical protein
MEAYLECGTGGQPLGCSVTRRTADPETSSATSQRMAHCTSRATIPRSTQPRRVGRRPASASSSTWSSALLHLGRKRPLLAWAVALTRRLQGRMLLRPASSLTRPLRLAVLVRGLRPAFASLLIAPFPAALLAAGHLKLRRPDIRVEPFLTCKTTSTGHRLGGTHPSTVTPMRPLKNFHPRTISRSTPLLPHLDLDTAARWISAQCPQRIEVADGSACTWHFRSNQGERPDVDGSEDPCRIHGRGRLTRGSAPLGQATRPSGALTQAWRLRSPPCREMAAASPRRSSRDLGGPSICSGFRSHAVCPESARCRPHGEAGTFVHI